MAASRAFGTLDDTTGGDRSRYSLQAEWHRLDENSATNLLLDGIYYHLDLFSNFTYFLDDPFNGDRFEQKDQRVHWGATATHTLFGDIFGRETQTQFGLQFRQDIIRNGLYLTAQRERLRHQPDEVEWLVPHRGRLAGRLFLFGRKQFAGGQLGQRGRGDREPEAQLDLRAVA